MSPITLFDTALISFADNKANLSGALEGGSDGNVMYHCRTWVYRSIETKQSGHVAVILKIFSNKSSLSKAVKFCLYCKNECFGLNWAAKTIFTYWYFRPLCTLHALPLAHGGLDEPVNLNHFPSGLTPTMQCHIFGVCIYVEDSLNVIAGPMRTVLVSEWGFRIG